ncbi:MAG: hypothetical protein Q9M92_07210 [Enterobacterales bacterium]|nr:hypothetical protein [Enterobacterales bacterium]
MQRLTSEEFVALATQNSDSYWFAPAFTTLSKAFYADKMVHGLLLVSPEMSGKAEFAAKLSKSILCNASSGVQLAKPNLENNTAAVEAELNQRQIGYSCNQCKSCQLFNSGSHPDLYFNDRLLNKQGKVKQNISIDQIRLLTDKLSSTAQMNGWRIGVIASVEKLSRGAFNALLKSLEEPGQQTLLILLVNQFYRVPQTIRSRCQKLTFDLNSKQLVPWLMRQTQCDIATAEDAIKHTESAPLAAKVFIENGSADDYSQLSRDLDSLLNNQLSPQQVFSQHKHLDEQLWRYMANYFTQVPLKRLTDPLSPYAKLPKTSAFDLYNQLLQYHKGQSLGSNLQFQLQIESILNHWFEIGRKIVHYSNHTH